MRNRIWRDLDNDGNRDENEEVYHGNSCNGDGEVDLAGINFYHNSAWVGEHNQGCMVGPANPTTFVSIDGTGEDFISMSLPSGYEIINVTLGPNLTRYDYNTIRSYEVGNGNYTDAYWLIRPLPLNCSDISGPSTIVRGQSGTFGANFTSGLGGLRSGFFYDPLSTPALEVNPFLPDWTWYADPVTNASDTRTRQFNTAGTFNVCCRAVGNGRECRPGGYDSGYDTCTGPNTCMTVNVITPTPSPPPPTTPPVATTRTRVRSANNFATLTPLPAT